MEGFTLEPCVPHDYDIALTGAATETQVTTIKGKHLFLLPVKSASAF